MTLRLILKFIVCAATLPALLRFGGPALAQSPAEPSAQSQKDAKKLDKAQHTLTGDIRLHDDLPTKILKAPRPVAVYLPPGYDAPENAKRHYPTLYLQDGQNVFDSATAFVGKEWRVDETAETLIKAGLIEPLIIVAIYNGGAERANEYTPTYRADEMGGVGGKADEYGRFVIEELKPFVDKTYRTRPEADNTGIGGSSLGALVSFYTALRHPDVFRRVAIVSPSVWWDDKCIIKQVNALPKKLPFLLWLDIGTKEGYQSLPETRLLRDALLAKGWRMNRDLTYREAEGMAHNEEAWSLRVEPLLRFLYPPQK